MINLFKFSLFIIILNNFVYSQSILDDYIQAGLKNNLALQQKEFSYQKSISSLKESKGLFLPSVNLNSRYTKAGGGRTIDLPIGDLVNPIYTGLNSLIGQSVYPTNIANQSINFLRETEQETKITLIQPLFHPQIYFNYTIKDDLTLLQKSERDAFARDIVKEIKTAYYNYLKTVKVVNLYKSTEDLVKENLRVTNALHKNDKVTIDLVFRAETEVSKINDSRSEAEKNKDIARSYFNFLLNKSLTDTILIDEFELHELENIELKEELFSKALSEREELLQLDYAISASEGSIKLNKSNFLPNLIFAVDYGFQGEKFSFTKEDDYWMASMVLQWNLFNGFQDDAKIEQSEWTLKEYKSRKFELEKIITLQLRESVNNYNLSIDKLITSRNRKKTSEEIFRLVSKKFENGMVSQIELIDARTNLTQSSINEILNYYDALIDLAVIERFTASYYLSTIEK